MLNSSQQAVADYFMEFLADDDQTEMIIDAPAGYGKSYLVKHLVDTVFRNYKKGFEQLGVKAPYTSVAITATTNKAADSLAETTSLNAITIHNLFSLLVTPDYKTGETNLKKTKNTCIAQDIIIFIDECSMIDKELYTHIQQLTHHCKIVYVGDKYQLCPVKSGLSPIYTKNLPELKLTIPMRNQNHKELIDLCNQLQKTVETGVFNDIAIVPGVIDLYSASDTQQAITDAFVNNTLGDTRVLTYTNKKSTEFNEFIKQLRNHTETFTEGDIMISCGVCKLSNSSMVHVEDEIYIKKIHKRHELIEVVPGFTKISFTLMEIIHKGIRYIVKVPESFNQIRQLTKELAKKKLWVEYFTIKEAFLDLRPKESCTIHKAQGSTLDTVIIDISDLSTCTIPNMAARLLYVAVSRAKSRVIFYGSLKSKYGNFLL